MEALEYWRDGHGLENLTPKNKQHPEGEDYRAWIGAILYGWRVCDFGCGRGRLAHCFDPAKYIGVDICPQVIEQARELNPRHAFLLDNGELPNTDVLYAHTVLLHIPDKLLDATLDRFDQKYVFIAEIMDRKWRRSGDPPVFNRSIQDYKAAMKNAGYDYEMLMDHPYPHYPDTDISVGVFKK